MTSRLGKFEAGFSARAAGVFPAIGLALALTGCVTASGSLPPIPPDSAPVTGSSSDLRPYKVQVGDVLNIRLIQNPELSEEVTVRPDGMISTALAEDIPAYNRTPSEISAELRGRYKSDLRNPRISVAVHSFAPNRVYVGGEVVSPGEFITVGPNLTISQAIARAGGVKLSADRNRIFVIRRSPDGRPVSYSVNYKGIISGRTPAADAHLTQYDVVYVPRTGIYELFTFWNQFVQQFLPVSWGFSYNVNPQTTVNNR